jgi:Protein of unknown function (DUF3570)
MQLGGLARFIVTTLLAWMLATTTARAEGSTTGRASTEVAGYTDSVGVSIFTPSVGASVESPTSGWGANGRYLVDVVSAASPDIVATASPRWSEVRHAGNVGARYKPGRFGIGLGGAASYTPDYLALSGNAQLVQELDDKNLALVEGYSFGRDTIGRTGTPFSVFSNQLTTHAFSLGLSRVVNPSLVIGVYGDAILERGDQSKPYRYVPMFAPEIAPSVPRGASAITVADSRLVARPLEQLPLTRDRWAVSGRMGWRTEHTTLRLEQRLYTDSWNLKATTTDLRWFVDVAERITIWPHLRVHVQSGVDFWRRAYAARSVSDLPALRTGDRELGPLSNFGLGAGIRFALGKAGAKDDFVLSFTGDGTWTSFTDALYVKDRFSGIGATSLEVVF